MSLPPYLESNLNRIVNLPNQQIALWNTSYDSYKEDYEVVKVIYDHFPQRNLQRKGVIELFKEDHYTGFIGAMMWGGINGTRPQRGGGGTNFKRLLDFDRAKVEKAIVFAREAIKRGNIEELFSRFNGNNTFSLPGVGPAYFTKLFFFLGELDEVDVRPLIFDKWTSNAHCALLISAECENLPYIRVNRYVQRCVAWPAGMGLAMLYKNYVSNMNSWTDELNSKFNVNLTPAKLEEFVFGSSLRTNNVPTNPRLELWEIIYQHFNR